LSPPEHDYLLQEANILLDAIQNFADTAVQYGFTVLFITALPIATFFSLVSNYIKVKLQIWKLIRFYQRPVPQGAQDIGTWQDIFNFISVAAVVTNGAIICFTMDVLYKDAQADNSRIYQIGGITARGNFTLVGRLWCFFGFIAVLIFVQFVSAYLIPDTPSEVEIQHERQEFIVSKIVNLVPDEGEQNVFIILILFDADCCLLLIYIRHFLYWKLTLFNSSLNEPNADYDDTLDSADAEELKADILANAKNQEEAVKGCCGGKAAQKAAMRKIELDGCPEVPIFEYPETIADVRENYTKKTV